GYSHHLSGLKAGFGAGHVEIGFCLVNSRAARSRDIPGALRVRERTLSAFLRRAAYRNWLSCAFDDGRAAGYGKTDSANSRERTDLHGFTPYPGRGKVITSFGSRQPCCEFCP